MPDTPRTDIRAAARSDLADTGSLWSDAQLNRCVDAVTGDIERLLPNEKATEIIFAQSITAESRSIAVLATHYALANKPIWKSSVKVENSAQTVTYTEDTDYEINYMAGTIAGLTGGLINAGDTVKVTYDKHRLMLDISGITDLMVPLEVEWPIDQVPESFAGFKRFGDYLHLINKGRGSQELLKNKDHVRIWYAGRHTAPTDTAFGTFPRFLTEVMIKGVVAYALFIKHRQSNLQARTDVASARTALLAADDDDTAISTALTNAATALTAAATALTNAATPQAATATAIATVNTIQTAALASLDTTTPTVATVRTSIAAAIAMVVTALDRTTTDIDTTTPTAATLRTSITSAIARVVTELDKAATALVAQAAQLVSATRNADLYLDTGDNILNTVPVGGPDAPQQYVQYALAKVQIATQYINEAQGRVAHGLAIVQEASASMGTFDRVLAEAQVRIQHGLAIIQEAAQNDQLFDRILGEVAARVSTIDRRLAEARENTELASSYIVTGQTRLQEANFYMEAAKTRLDRERRFIQIADGYFASANQETITADRFLADARERHADYWRMLQSRVQQMRQRSFSASQQWAQIGTGTRLYPTGSGKE